MIMEYIFFLYYIYLFVCLFADWIIKALKKLMMLIKFNVQCIVHKYIYLMYSLFYI